MGNKQSAVSRSIGSGKRALIFGFDYSGKNTLNGPVNDANLCKDTLISKYGFNSQNIIVLNDGDIMKPLTDFISTSGQDDINVIHYSGHGEYINGTDYLVREDLSKINSSQITNLLVKASGNFLIVIDACDSGSLVQLPFTCTTTDGKVTQVNNNTFSCNVLNFSAAGRDQNSYESKQVNGIIYGDFSYDFYTTLSNGQTLTWMEIYDRVYDLVKNVEFPILNSSAVRLCYLKADDYI